MKYRDEDLTRILARLQVRILERYATLEPSQQEKIDRLHELAMAAAKDLEAMAVLNIAGSIEKILSYPHENDRDAD